MSLAEAVAEQTSLALENSRLFREMLERHHVHVDDVAAAIAEIQRRYEAGFADEMPRVSEISIQRKPRRDAVAIGGPDLQVLTRLRVHGLIR